MPFSARIENSEQVATPNISNKIIVKVEMRSIVMHVQDLKSRKKKP